MNLQNPTAEASKSNPIKSGIKILENKKRRTDIGSDQQSEKDNTFEMHMGSDDEEIEVMDQDGIKTLGMDSKNGPKAGSVTRVRLPQ